MSKMDRSNWTYEQAMHAVQSGIAFLIGRGESLATPKHLRVGITSNFVTERAVANLLISKGVITEPEYHEAVRLAAIQEVEELEARIGRDYDVTIRLG